MMLMAIAGNNQEQNPGIGNGDDDSGDHEDVVHCGSSHPFTANSQLQT